jgi:hypothetical protein
MRTFVRRQPSHHVVKVGLSIRIGGSLNFRTLDARPHHAPREEGLATQKEFVVVSGRIRSSCQTAKSVEIQLPLKGG